MFKDIRSKGTQIKTLNNVFPLSLAVFCAYIGLFVLLKKPGGRVPCALSRLLAIRSFKGFFREKQVFVSVIALKGLAQSQYLHKCIVLKTTYPSTD